MLINVLVLAITAIMLMFVVVWLLSPSLRSSLEMPKYALAKWDGVEKAANATGEK